MKEDVLDSWAGYYDVMYSAKDDDDRDFYVRRAKEVGGRVLEIGVGTGRIYLDLLKEGVDAYGIDMSAEMLERLREKAEERGLEPEVEQADMRGFDMDEKFDLIMIPFRAFLHNLTTEDQVATLERCREHLTPDGELVLNFFFPTPEVMVEEYGEERELELAEEYSDYTLRERNDFSDAVNQVVSLDRELYHGGELVWNEELELALVYKKEFELLLDAAGFREWEVYGGFGMEPLESVDQEMVWIARP